MTSLKIPAWKSVEADGMPTEEGAYFCANRNSEKSEIIHFANGFFQEEWGIADWVRYWMPVPFPDPPGHTRLFLEAIAAGKESTDHEKMFREYCGGECYDQKIRGVWELAMGLLAKEKAFIQKEDA